MAWFLLLPTGRPSAGPGVGAPVFGEKQAMPGEGDKQDSEGHPTWLCPGSAHGVGSGKEEARNTPELASWPSSRGLSQCGRKALGVATTFLLQLRTTYKRTLPSACSTCVFLSSRQSNRFRTCGDWTGLDTATRKFLYTPKLGGPSLRVTPTLSE